MTIDNKILLRKKVNTIITYEPLWKTLADKNISTYKMLHTYKMSTAMIHKLKHNESITMKTLNELCNMFECEIADIIKYERD